MIGVLDIDFLLSPGWKFINLEAAKVLTYFYKNNKITKLIDNFENLKIYDPLYYFQNSNSIPIQNQCFQFNNIVWHGDVFTNNQYNFLEPKVENTIPDIYLYRSLINFMYRRGKIRERDVQDLMNGNYLRLASYNTKAILNPKGITFLYDRILCKDNNWFEKITELREAGASRMCLIFNHQFANNIDDFIHLQQLPIANNRASFITLPLIYKKKDLEPLIEKQQEITPLTRLHPSFVYRYKAVYSPIQHLTIMSKYLHSICFCWANKVNLTMTLINKEVQPFASLENRILQWMHNPELRNLSLKYVLEVNSPEVLTHEVKKIFKQYNILHPFYDVIPNELLKGGTVPYVWQRNL